MSKLTKVQIKAIDKSVTEQFLNAQHEDKTAEVLFSNGVSFSDIKSTIEATAHRLKLILSKEEIESKIVEGCKGFDKPANFYNLVKVANSINIPQINNDELLKAVQVHFKTNLKASSKYTCFFNGRGHYGKIADWVRTNPEFTPEEILTSGLIDAPNSEDYYNQFIGFRDLFKSIA